MELGFALPHLGPIATRDNIRQVTEQVLLGLDYMYRCCGVIDTGPLINALQLISSILIPFFLSDLRPENVLNCVDVFNIIQAEHTSPSANPSNPPAQIVGVPPPKG